MSARFLATVAAVSFSTLSIVSIASAADVGRPYMAPTSAPAVQHFSWTGAYVGIGGGYGTGELTLSNTYTTDTVDVRGGVFGGIVGYNWQIGNRWIVGLEATAHWSGLSDTTTTEYGCPTCGYFGSETVKTKLDFYSTTNLRLGFTPWERVMVYGKGGAAFGRLTTTASSSFTDPWGSWTNPASKETRWAGGWNVGAGVDWAVTPNIVVGLDYTHLKLDLGGNEYNSHYSTSRDFKADIFTASVKYKF